MTTPPRFLCDEMLGRLCRYLRAAGYDTLLAAARGAHFKRMRARPAAWQRA